MDGGHEKARIGSQQENEARSQSQRQRQDPQERLLRCLLSHFGAAASGRRVPFLFQRVPVSLEDERVTPEASRRWNARARSLALQTREARQEWRRPIAELRRRAFLSHLLFRKKSDSPRAAALRGSTLSVALSLGCGRAPSARMQGKGYAKGQRSWPK